jgi:hypothetical protein
VSSITGIAGVSVVGNAHLEVIDLLSLTADGFEGAEYILYVFLSTKSNIMCFQQFHYYCEYKKK